MPRKEQFLTLMHIQYQHQDLLLSDVEAVMLAFPRELLLKTDTFSKNIE